MKLDNAVALNPALLTNAKAPPSIPLKGKGLDEKAIDATAKDFEAMFMTEMLRPMFDTLDVDQNFGGGQGEQTYRSFMVDEYGKNLAANGGIGIAALVKEQLIAMQGKPATPDAPNASPAMAQKMQDLSQDQTLNTPTGDDDNV